MGAEPVNNASGADLKRLAFIRSYSDYYFQKGYGLASSVYSTGKSYAPDRFHGSIAAVEQTVSEYGTPLVTAVQDKSDQVLQIVDSKVRQGPASLLTTIAARRLAAWPCAGGPAVGSCS